MATECMDDIGRIEIRNDECFWILPTNYIFDKTIYFITSPWFTHLREKWRMELRSYGINDMLHLRLYNEFSRDRPSCKYTVQFKIETSDVHRTVFREGESTYDFGFKASNFCSRTDILSCVQHSGQIKIFFSINEKHDVDNVYSTGTVEEKSNENGKSSTDEAVGEDEASSEDEITSDEEDSEKRKVSSKIKGIKRLAENFKQVFLDGRLSDVVLRVDSREFNVHKLVLVARSPVFASMFEHDLAEKKTNLVDIPDCVAESFEVFLHYLYSGSAETMSVGNVYNVYYAADKYCVDDLKEQCVRFMKMNLSAETFCDTISLCLRHGESELQKKSVVFFCKNIKNIIKTVQWQKYLAENPTHANELLIKALKA